MTSCSTMFYEEKAVPSEWPKWIGNLWMPWEFVADVDGKKIKMYSPESLARDISLFGR